VPQRVEEAATEVEGIERRVETATFDRAPETILTEACLALGRRFAP